jgi:hypothetical protein
MKRILSISLLLLFFTVYSAYADDFQVYGMRTDFPMADGEAIIKDFYVNLGTNHGVKAGSTLIAFREVTTADNLAQKSAAKVRFPVARLKVIHSEASAAVARLLEMLPAKETPASGYTNVMVGDLVELTRK